MITNEDGMLKRGSSGNGNRPDFAIMNPVLTYTLPAYQTACGSTDILAHMMERCLLYTSPGGGIRTGGQSVFLADPDQTGQPDD